MRYWTYGSYAMFCIDSGARLFSFAMQTMVRHEGAERSEMSYSLTAAMLHKR